MEKNVEIQFVPGFLHLSYSYELLNNIMLEKVYKINIIGN